ncbi:hypothetical protein [Thiobaca trueperi]|uniref:Nucleoside 2-deoxyribosyltransferase n=1 Tax=Thiobaca trueperi TaxID=127458 RepID=A0A4R3N2L8_9GAMM|nr:hypothetical protein [Thiobaca trueperi]TCT22974.1 hypothetical protein EDC35_102305 [Thiobaca trueperi]
MLKEKTCFVVMAIGDQEYNGKAITAQDLKSKYDDLIKEAILKASPEISVVRADDISLPGSISSDILTHLMHADYVIADVTYPNPNVYYELGLRHASRPGTIIIRDSSGPKVPFDISHLRHFEYENTATGLKSLASNLKAYFDLSVKNPGRPDNQFLELAKLTKYEFPNYIDEPEEDPVITAIMSLITNPDTAGLLVKAGSGQEVNQAEMLSAIFQNPTVGQNLLKAMLATGHLDQGEIFGKQSQKGLPSRNRPSTSQKRRR